MMSKTIVSGAHEGRSVRVALTALLTLLILAPSAALAALSAPTGLAATAVSGSQIRLTWSDSNTSETGFAVERSLNGSSFTARATVGVNATSYTDSGLLSGVRYYYRIQALGNGNNKSAYSNTASAVTLSATSTSTTTSTTSSTVVSGVLPTKPTGLIATVLSCSQIRLSWNASIPGTYPIAGYDVYRWTGTTWVSMLPAGTRVFSPYTVSGLSLNVTYYYAVEAVDTHGGRSGLSGWTSALISSSTCGTSSTTSTSIATVTTTSTTLSGQKPTVPTWKVPPLTVLSCSQIRLDWNASSPGSYPIAGYDVYRWTGSAWVSILPTGTPVPTLTYTNSNLSASTTYYYSVEAVDTHGGRSGLNAWKSAATGSCSISSTTSTTLATNAPPVPYAGTDQTVPVGTAVTLNGSGSYDPDGSIVSYSWNFGDGTTGSNAIVSHTYATTGQKTATLTVTDNRGAARSDAALVTVTTGGTSTGAFRWNRQVPASSGTSWSRAQGVAVDSAGNVVVVGTASGTVDFGAGWVSGTDGLFVAKYGPSGTLLWAKRVGPGGSMVASSMGVAVDASGNIVVTGYFQGTIDLGGGPLTSAGAGDIFLVKFTSSGGHLWSKRFGGAISDAGDDVTIDGSGNVLVTGKISSSVDFGGGTLSGAVAGTVFVAKYTSSGAHAWSRSFSGAGAQYPGGVATDSSGNVIVAGGFQTAADFGGGPLTGAGGTDLFVAKYAPTGTYLWAKRGGGALSDKAEDVAVEQATGSITVTGHFGGTANFGGSNLAGGSGSDVLVVQYSASGTHLWSKGFGEGADCSGDSGMGVAVDSAGNVVLTGVIICWADFGGGVLLQPYYGSQADIFIAKLSAAGGHLWSRKAGTPGSGDLGAAIATGPDGSVNVVGKFDGSFGGSIDFGGGPMTAAFVDAFVVQFAP